METGKLKEIIDYLKMEPKIEYNPYPVYDDRIFELLSSLGTEMDYLEKHAELKEKDIFDMNLDEIRVMYTFAERGERFCDGCIAGFIEDGTLLKLAKRQYELLKK